MVSARSTRSSRARRPHCTGFRRAIASRAVFRKGVDGHAYQRDNGKWYRLLGGEAQAIDESEPLDPAVPCLTDGCVLVEVTAEGEWKLRDPASGEVTTGRFECRRNGMEPFVLGQGPDGCIYGSTALPS